MNSLELRLSKIEPSLYVKFEETKKEIELMLGKYTSNFPTYTDHSVNHTLEVFKIASELLSDDELENLNADEVYILSMACLLHDVGMCVPEEKIKEISNSKEILDYKESHPNLSSEEFIRDIHHTLSKKFILEEWELLKIPSVKYAKAIGIVAEGHRKVDLGNFDIYEPEFFCKSGKEFVSLPYLACILRIADELDVTNSRTPKILTKYYLPNNAISIKEWKKHIATSQRNYSDNKVIFEVDCSDQNIYAALQEQFDKIQNVINYCQKVIRAIPFIKSKKYDLLINLVYPKYNYINFHPKGIKFSFDVQNVVTAFIGEDLYKDKFTSIREAVQNSIDSCRYKSKVLKEDYIPEIKLFVDNEFLRIEDNGAGMDEFIIENFFGRLASSFYEQDKIKSQFEAIGQFGVGVFSYFLLSEYIDIETKTAKSTAVKFRFDKDPKSYFHFYDKTDRTLPGTTITMYLKKEIIKDVTFNVVEKYIRKIFKHIEIPIEVSDFNNKKIIEFQSFKIDSEKEIMVRLQLKDKKLNTELMTIAADINDDDMEGTCALIICRNYLETFQYANRYFDYDEFKSFGHRNPFSQISVSQKGVFVNNYESASLNMLIGKINLKKKIKINIDRNEFAEEDEVFEYIQKFELKILKELFSTLEKKYNSDDEKIKITQSFIENYFDYDVHLIDQEYINLILNSMYVKVFYDRKYLTIKMSELPNIFDEFIVIENEEDNINFFSNIKKPLVITSETIYRTLCEIFIDFLKYNVEVIFHNEEYFKVFKVKPYDKTYRKHVLQIMKLLNSFDFQFSKINSQKFLVKTWRSKEITHSFYYSEYNFFNYNHSFTQFIINNYDAIVSDSNHKKIIESVFTFIQDMSKEKIDTNSIIKLNDMIQPLNEITPISNFVLEDF